MGGKCEKDSRLRLLISHCELISTIKYNPLTGTFTDNKGKVRGTYDKSNGYCHTIIRGRKYYLHRLAWFYVHGVWPDFDVDHKNRNRTDNRIGNLREATETQNQGNKKLHKNNTSGCKGVRWVASRNRFRVTIWMNGKYNNVGSFKTIEEAAKAYDEAAIKYFGEYALTNEMLQNDARRPD